MRSNYRSDVEKNNVLFEKFYNELGLLGEHEGSEFWTALRRELPNSFRFTGSKGQALPVQKLLKDRYVPEITAIKFEGAPVSPPTALPWFPDQLAWQMTTPKNVVRKFPPFAAFQKFLVSETSVGNINRQEAVSMIPPLFMDLAPHMTVLDMCAAPGSKTAQLVEAIHTGEEARMRATLQRSKTKQDPEPDHVKQEEDTRWPDGGRATGLVIANDTDYRRAHMLTHQMKRLNSPNLIVTNHDATMFPSIKISSESEPRRYLKFDRILADVPCSGDGTCRKNVNVWKDWVPGNALGLHSTQWRILVRSLQMLKVGGRVVYSTCSMNPVENEAIIATAIERCGGSSHVELVDCDAYLPQLKRRPGLRNWKVMDKAGDTWSSWSDFEKRRAREGGESLGKLSDGMFPREQIDIPLERCMRVLPHLQDTGAFFIAVLEKKKEIKARTEPTNTETSSKPTGIVDVVNALEKQDSSVDNPGGKIDALDDIIAPIPLDSNANAGAAAIQNQENEPDDVPASGLKRELDAEGDVYESNKRPKFRDGPDNPSLVGAANNREHWPPPPNATITDPPPAENGTHAPNPNNVRHMDTRLPKRHNQPYEEPFKYLSQDLADLTDIWSFYHISPSFPRDRFMVRNALGVPAKTIYYTSSLARDILTYNASTGIKFVHCGVKMFVKQDAQGSGACPWRIQSEGLPLIESWVGEERVVRLYKRSTLRALLIEMFPKIEGPGWDALGEIKDRVKDIGFGCCVLRVEASNAGEEDTFDREMVLPLWRSAHSLNLMLPKEERSAMLLRLFGEMTPLMDHSKDRFQKKEGDAKVVIVKEEEDDEVDDEAKDEAVSDEDDGGGVPIKAE